MTGVAPLLDEEKMESVEFLSKGCIMVEDKPVAFNGANIRREGIVVNVEQHDYTDKPDGGFPQSAEGFAPERGCDP